MSNPRQPFKPGQRAKDEPPGEQLIKITFKVDPLTFEALQELEKGRPAVRGRRSALLREIIWNARVQSKKTF